MNQVVSESVIFRPQGRYDLLVFDWDGTLMNSTALIAMSLQRACADMGLAPPPLKACEQVIGLGLAEAIQSLVPDLPPSQHGQLADYYRRHYFAADAHPPLFDGVREMLLALRAQGFFLAVATGKSRRGLDAALEHGGVGDLFDKTRCADETFSKPHPAMLLAVMDELGVAPQRSLMIGDTTHDILMAQNAGVDALAITHGAHDLASLKAAGVCAVVDSIAELSAWLQANA